MQNKLSNRKSFQFLICLLLAATAWFINKLTKEYTHDVPYTVCVYSSANTMEPVCAVNDMYVRIKAQGFYIMLQSHKLNIDIKKLKFTRSVDENNTPEYTLPTRLLHNAIKEAIGDAVRMETIITDNLYFETN